MVVLGNIAGRVGQRAVVIGQYRGVELVSATVVWADRPAVGTASEGWLGLDVTASSGL